MVRKRGERPPGSEEETTSVWLKQDFGKRFVDLRTLMTGGAALVETPVVKKLAPRPGRVSPSTVAPVEILNPHQRRKAGDS